MENLFYVPLEKDGEEFVQNELLTKDELLEYHISNYNKIIENNFYAINAIVKLRTGKYRTTVYKPIDELMDIYFCVVNSKNFPNDINEISLSKEILTEIRKNLSMKVRFSEGIFSEQIIDIPSTFVTPRVRFLKSENDSFYNFKLFQKDCFIFGAPGSGKTTMLRKLTLDYLSYLLESEDKLNKLPIYIQLREFNDYPNDFNSYVDNCIYNSFSNIDFYIKNDLTNTGNLCLMLDGADEIDFEKFHSFRDTIINYKKKYPLISFIITSRPDLNYENIEGFEKVYIQPFNKQQVKELTYRKLAKLESWDEYISILNSAPEIYEVLKNPLLLTISHFLYQHKSIIPINTGQLVKELVATLISNWDSQRNVERKFENKKVSPIEITNSLGKMALCLSERKTASITTKELLDLYENYDSADELDRYLHYIEFATGIIQRDSKLHWSFSHKSLQDFLCSTYLVESINELNKTIFFDKDWGKVLLMISGLSSDPNFIINNILQQPKMDNIEKLKASMSIYNESHLLSKNDLKNSFELVEKFFISFEKEHSINSCEVRREEEKVLISFNDENVGLKELISLMKVIFQIRFTKYEYDFFGYLNKSDSKILNSMSSLALKKGNISFVIGNNNTEIHHNREPKGAS